MKMKFVLMVALLAAPLPGIAARSDEAQTGTHAAPQTRLNEADRKVTVGRILLKWGDYVEKVNGQDRRTWAASLWPSLASADLDNLQKASRAVTYEGMRNALLGQRPHDEQIIDRLARLPKGSGTKPKVLGNLAADLVFTPVTPCRIVDTRVPNDRIGAGGTRSLDAANPGGNFSLQGGSDTDCGIPANPAALALSVTGLGNLTTGYLRVYPFDGTSAQGSPIPIPAVNTTVTNDMIVPTCQGCAQELKVFSTANTHYAAFVTGYFMAPQATPLECTEGTPFSSASTISFTISTGGSCPTGFKEVGVNCKTSSNSDDVYLKKAYISGGFSAVCQFANKTGLSVTYTVSATCCRIPGR